MLTFRNGTKEDAVHIATLETKSFTDAWSSRSIEETLEQNNAFIVVSELERKLVGYCIVYCVMDEAEIVRIAVGKDARRQGIGKGLLDAICVRCTEKRVQTLLLDVRESNMGARAFYEKYGFHEDGIRKNFYDNPKEHAILMSVTLE